ncbi:MAG: DNA-directed RNA polymerase subunit omega [bacterium]|nr:DNA-directed RNA polymerase subunit omega [bacterium]
MIYPAIDNLLKRVDSKYTLVILAAKRARELIAAPKNQSVTNKHVSWALKEIDERIITYERIFPVDK